ncbi:MAG TPA: beta-propeller domain-containing protein [Pyrinomonadaceae bacterium]|nr:beta-propeller domain-containing protein [Pyrinomonadaceae bacterium]
MKTSFLVATLALLFLGIVGYAQWPSLDIPPIERVTFSPVKKTMRPFRSDQELAAYFKELAEKQKTRFRGQADSVGTVANSAAPAQEAQKAGAVKDESITNTQVAGVDEGGIVKMHGDHLVVLRRGRLFTVRVGDDTLQPISATDAFGPEIDPVGTWYDEMLVSEDTVAVIGYSYQRGGTEVGLFSINDAGKLNYRSTYHLRSNDYYSSRNYASRLLGNKLIFYTPQYIYPGSDDPFGSFPAVRKWHRDAKPEEFQRIVPATKVYRPEQELDGSYGTALHTVTVCDLANGGFACGATSVIGPLGRVFYVSENAVYVWVSDWRQREQGPRSDSMVYRLPLDGSGPSALGVSGSPVDQFSFLESDDAHLNVLVRSNSSGDGMWGAEVAAGDVALMRVPLATFSDGRDVVPSSSYHALPKPIGYTFQNRFVGNHLLYGTGSGWGEPEHKNQSSLFVANWRDGDWQRLLLPHGVDRIEQMGDNAVVVGTNGRDLDFTSIRLGEIASLADTYSRKDASQGELRSHGFFYKPNGPNSGTLGLPISTPARPGYRHLFETSAAILFLRNNNLHFEEVGELAARSDKAVDDACRASCVDWYGNARPLFFQGRVLALLGYEIVEGAINEGQLRELRRVNYAPGRVAISRG